MFLPPNIRDHGGQNNRIEFIDLAKGICILLVVLFHFNTDIFEFPNFKALRMPLYFVLSGLFFKDYGNYKIFLLKKCNNILIPFLFWLIVSFVIAMIVQLLFAGITYPWENAFAFIYGEEIIVNVPLWFLFCLFTTSIIFLQINRFSSSNKQLLISVILLAFIGNLLRFFNTRIPLWIDSSLTALPFFYIGFILKKSQILNGNRNLKELCLGLFLIGISYLIFFVFDETAFDLRSNATDSNPILVYINSMCFVLGTLLLCKFIKWIPLVSYIGRYSIIILCTHMIVSDNIAGFFKIFSGSYFGDRLYYFPLYFISLIALIPICKYFIPHFTAQKALIKMSNIRLIVQ